MAGKRSRIIWIILVVIVLVVVFLSMYSCSYRRTSVNVSDFKEVIKEIDNPIYDGKLSKARLESLTENKIITTVKSVNRTYDSVKIQSVVIDGYNIKFNVQLLNGDKANGTLLFVTTFARNNLEEYEAYLDGAGIDYSYTETVK